MPDLLDTVTSVRLQGKQCDDEALRAAQGEGRLG
jgi:hypothetical protein